MRKREKKPSQYRFTCFDKIKRQNDEFYISVISFNTICFLTRKHKKNAPSSKMVVWLTLTSVKVKSSQCLYLTGNIAKSQ